ncbi:MAG: hypothetical protein A3205_09035 [Methanomassiliicoccales archaeon Mx-03]|nr:MAG: hypothetical protein A3205_09035 [Methanomassiliicoccales archaeon Mx-03]
MIMAKNDAKINRFKLRIDEDSMPTPLNRETKVAIYSRVSTNKQTTDNQIERLKAVADARGYVVFDVYSDTASGAKSHRPELDRMLADAKRHQFDRIIATKLDRIARSTINLLNIMEDLGRYGVEVEFIDQPIDTSAASGHLLMVVLGAIAEFERELIRDRVNDGLERARAEGKKMGRKPRHLTPYQREKLLAILEENPDISQRKLAEQFDGISRATLIKLAKEEGLIQ